MVHLINHLTKHKSEKQKEATSHTNVTNHRPQYKLHLDI